MEAPMARIIDRQRYLVPSLIILGVMAALSIGIFLTARQNSRRTAGRTTGAAAAPAAATASAKSDKDAPKEKAPVPVSVTAAVRRPISSYISATANLVAENEVKIVSEAEGRVASLLVEEGTVVAKGQALAALVRDDADIALTKARVRSRNAQLAFTRANEMYGKGLVSRSDFDKSTLERDVAEQELAEARWMIGKTTIRAPFGGRVTERMIGPGQHVRPGDSLFTITDFDPLIARIYLPEKDVVPLSAGRDVRIRLKADEKIVFGGHIRQISPVVDTATGTVKVTVEAVRPPEAVRPGAFVTLEIVRETHPGAVLVPREAILRELRESHVFVASGGVARRKSVTLGIEEGDFIEATAGVSPGDQIITAGQGGLKDGSPIKVLPTKTAQLY